MNRGRGEAAMVPRAEPASYYGRPVIKPPVWSAEVPWYLFAGGLAGASAVLGTGAGAAGNRPLARRAWLLASAGVAASPPLLISDLGRPERFLNMMRVFKVTSPMSMGSWILAASGGATTVATAHELFGWFGRLGPLAKLASTALGPALAHYTGVLVGDTAAPPAHGAPRARARLARRPPRAPVRLRGRRRGERRRCQHGAAPPVPRRPRPAAGA